MLRRHVLPQAYGVVLTQATVLVPAFMLAEVALSFVGLGVNEPRPSWGNMLYDVASNGLVAAKASTFAPALLLVAVTLLYQTVLSSFKGSDVQGAGTRTET